jgi:2-methylaconitate cis-trans-isomerase PrpF
LGDKGANQKTIRIGHPTGVITVDSEAEYQGDDPEPSMKYIRYVRTARPLLDGQAYIRNSVIQK